MATVTEKAGRAAVPGAAKDQGLKQVLLKKIQDHRPRTQKLLKEFGNVKVGEVTMAQTIGGARGVRCLVTDISYLDPSRGSASAARRFPRPSPLSRSPRL